LDLRAGAETIRPLNCAMIGFAVIVGEFVSKPAQIQVLPSVLGFLTGFFVCAYSMAVNDIYDVEVDRVNQPGRPIPSGRLSPGAARRLSQATLLAGMACSVLSLSLAAVVIAGVYAFLSWLYNARAKQAGLAGNLIVASSLAIPFIYGGVVARGDLASSLLVLMALTAFFSGVGREVVKAMADTEGDEKRHVRSVAISAGMGTAAKVGGAFFVLAVVTSWVPLLAGMANPIYTYSVAVPDIIFAYLAVSIATRGDAANARRVKSAALLGMLVGLFVFIGGAF
jgi:geranylgeranylglycerol-phosphate geranylgeranyltransferase